MAFNACPCMPLGKGVKILAVLNAILDGILCAILVVLLILDLDGLPKTPYPTSLRVFFIVMFPAGLVLYLLDFGLSIVLFTGVKRRSPNIFKIWSMFMGFIIVLCVLCFFGKVFVEGYLTILDILVVFWVPFKIFEILVVYALFREVTDGMEEGNGQVLSMTDTRPLAPTTNPPNNYTQTPQ
ncbi:unnamed protein product [Orchesella dallaii]|uniref:Uncharacterized protein n=1 Tax=Orchesella dallaii TaxID=48710 RepID=A0ABP1PZG0_9HEXA